MTLRYPASGSLAWSYRFLESNWETVHDNWWSHRMLITSAFWNNFRKVNFPVMQHRRIYYLIKNDFLIKTSWAVSDYVLYKHKVRFKIGMWLILLNCHSLSLLSAFCPPPVFFTFQNKSALLFILSCIRELMNEYNRVKAKFVPLLWEELLKWTSNVTFFFWKFQHIF